MVYVRSRKFCCCLPVRFGVFVMSILDAAICGLGAYAGWTTVIQRNRAGFSAKDNISLYVVSILYTLGALISIFGFVGAIIRGRRLVSLFATALAIHLGFHIVTGAYSLYTLFHTSDAQQLQNCQSKATGSTGLSPNNTVALDACKAALKIAKGISVGAFVLVLLIELYGVIIAYNYAEQLDEEESADYQKYNTNPYVTNNYYNSQAALVQNRA